MKYTRTTVVGKIILLRYSSSSSSSHLLLHSPHRKRRPRAKKKIHKTGGISTQNSTYSSSYHNNCISLACYTNISCLQYMNTHGYKLRWEKTQSSLYFFCVFSLLLLLACLAPLHLLRCPEFSCCFSSSPSTTVQYYHYYHSRENFGLRHYYSSSGF